MYVLEYINISKCKCNLKKSLSTSPVDEPVVTVPMISCRVESPTGVTSESFLCMLLVLWDLHLFDARSRR
jgi:hypothetical protein